MSAQPHANASAAAAASFKSAHVYQLSHPLDRVRAIRKSGDAGPDPNPWAAKCTKYRLERSRWRGGHCLSAAQPAAVAEVRLGHKEGGSCDPFTQKDAGRAPAPQLFRRHDSSLSASGPTVCYTHWEVTRQVRSTSSDGPQPRSLHLAWKH